MKSNLRVLTLKYLLKIIAKASKLLGYARGFFYFGKKVYVEGGVTIMGIENIKIGSGSRIGAKTILDCSSGKIHMGNNANISHHVTIIANQSLVQLGNNCHVGEYSQIAAYMNNDITIGNNTLLAPFNFIISSNHGFDKNDLIRNQKGFGFPILIEDDIWIAAKCTILAGSIIKKGSVVGANSLINKKSEKKEYGIYAGSPIKLISERN